MTVNNSVYATNKKMIYKQSNSKNIIPKHPVIINENISKQYIIKYKTVADLAKSKNNNYIFPINKLSRNLKIDLILTVWQ